MQRLGCHNIAGHTCRLDGALMLVLGALVFGPIGAVAAQEVAASEASRGAPRFLVAQVSPRARPIPLDVSRTEVLVRRIAVDFDGVPLKDALSTISDRARLPLVYGDGVLPAGRRVYLRAEQITVAGALTDMLVDLGVDVLFSRSGGATLVRRQSTLLGVLPGKITGRVTDAKTGQAVPNTDVLLENTKWRVVTDTSGWYALVEVDTGTYTLTARRPGYAKRSRLVTVRTGQVDTVDLTLELLAVKLDELITTATGQQRRRDIGNAITTIRVDSVMRTAPIRNLTELLENRVPGLTAQRISGAPGDPTRLRLRGLGSVERGNDLVVVVDGIRIYSAQAEARSGNLTNLGNAKVAKEGDIGDLPTRPLVSNVPAPSPLDQIDPNIIEKIEVFKGPSAATLYGADAANGVIVITTKRGRPGPTRWNANIAHGRTTIPGRWPEGYFRWGHVLTQGGAPYVCSIRDIYCEQDSLVRFQGLNEPSLTLLGTGQTTDLSLTASGGNQALTYNITGSYNDEMGLLQLPAFEAQRFRTRFNREVPDWMLRPHHYKTWSVTSNVGVRLSPAADLRLMARVYRSNQLRSDLETKAPALAGTYVDLANGLYYKPRSAFDCACISTTTSTYLQDYYTRTTASQLTFATGLSADWRLGSWLTARGQAGIDVGLRDDQSFRPGGLVRVADSGAVIQGTGRTLVSTFELGATATKRLGWGFTFTTSFGTNLVTNRIDDLVSSATGLAPGTSAIAGASTTSSTDAHVNTSSFGWHIEPRIAGERFSLSTGIRLDGGSDHGAQLTRTGGVGNLLSLPKLTGSWVISEEPWFPFTALFSSLQLRVAYGQAQKQPSPTDRLRLYTGRPEDRLKLTTVGNTKLRPERAVEFEGGFAADLLDSRVSVDFTAYRKTQVDAVMPVTLPGSVNGGGSTKQNIGNVRNRGIEFLLGVIPVRTSQLTWNVQLMYSSNSNTLMKLGRGVLADKERGLVEGYPLNGRWAKPIVGYFDQNGNGVLETTEIHVGDSLVYMGRLFPDYQTTLSTGVTLFGGAVMVTADFSYDAGRTQIDQTSRENWVLIRALSDVNTPLSQQAAIIASTAGVAQTDYGLMQDISTFRFNTFSVNYSVPTRVARLLRAQAMTLKLSGKNLAMHSTYSGKDPNVTQWSPGEGIVDTGQLPVPREWNVAVYLQY